VNDRDEREARGDRERERERERGGEERRKAIRETLDGNVGSVQRV